MLGDIHDASDYQNDVVRIRSDGTTHRPMSSWMPARSTCEAGNAPTIAILHVDSHVVNVSYRRPVPQFNVDSFTFNSGREVYPGRQS
jgi:hypothetical protein